MISKAIVAEVDFGFTKIEGLRLPNGEYAIAVTQANEVLQFSTIQSNAARDVKSLLGGGLSDHQKVVTELNSRPAFVLTIPQFTKLVMSLAKKGNPTAFAFVEVLVEEGIETRFDSAFKEEVTKKERNERLTSRIQKILDSRRPGPTQEVYDETIKYFFSGVRPPLGFKPTDIDPDFDMDYYPKELRWIEPERGFY